MQFGEAEIFAAKAIFLRTNMPENFQKTMILLHFPPFLEYCALCSTSTTSGLLGSSDSCCYDCDGMPVVLCYYVVSTSTYTSSPFFIWLGWNGTKIRKSGNDLHLKSTDWTCFVKKFFILQNVNFYPLK